MHRTLFTGRLTINTCICLVIGLFVVSIPDGRAQSKKDPAAYMSYIGSRYNELSIQFYQYMSVVAHSRNARRIEKQRSELLALSWDTYTDVRTMAVFKGNRALRDSAAAFLRINHRVLKEDYDKILNMELISERSFDDMEAYMTAQREARNKLHVANIRMLAEQKKFAALYRLTLVERTDELFLRMRQADEVLNYLNQVYLIFFRSHKDDIYMVENMAEKDVEAIGEYRKRLINSSRTGLGQLESIKTFRGDASLGSACRTILEFYEREAASGVNLLMDYLIAEVALGRARTSYEALPREERNADATERYNEAVRQMNAAADAYNASSRQLNAERLRLIENWRAAYDRFLADHIPRF
jgi:hypothetical protein